MNMVRQRIASGNALPRQRIAIDQFDILLPTQLAENLSDLRTQASVELSPPVFWYDNDMILTVPLHMGLATPVFHLGSSRTLRGLPREDPFYTPGTAEPSEYSPAELVVYEHELNARLRHAAKQIP